MRNFAEYRKSDLKSKVYRVHIQEGFERLFDVLRIDLTESVRLPDVLFEGNVAYNFAYNKAREADHEQNKSLVESLIRYYKANFYECLLSEADAIASDPYANFKSELIQKVKDLVANLRTQVAQILATSRATGDSDAAGDVGQQAPAGGNGVSAGPGAGSSVSPPAGPGAGSSVSPPAGPGAGSSSGPGAAHHVAPGGSSYGPSHGGHGLGPRSHSPRGPYDAHPSGEVRPVDPNTGYQPAPYWSMRPSDGFWGGFKRLIGHPLRWATRPIRRVWHNDPTREHTEEMMNLFLENVDLINDKISDFENELISFITHRLDAISTAATGAPVPPSPSAGGPTTSIPMPSGPGKGKVTPRGASTVAATGTEQPTGDPQVDAATDEADPDASILSPDQTSTVDQAAAGDPNAVGQVRKAIEYLKRGCEALGLETTYNGKWTGGGFDPEKLLIDGIPALTRSKGEDGTVQKQWAYKWSALRNLVYQRIYERFINPEGQPIPSRFFHKNTVSPALEMAVEKYFGVPIENKKNGNPDSVKEVLMNLGRMLIHGQIGPENAPAMGRSRPDKIAGGEGDLERSTPVIAPQTTTPTQTQGSPASSMGTPTAPGKGPVSHRGATQTQAWPHDTEPFITQLAKSDPSSWDHLVAHMNGDDEAAYDFIDKKLGVERMHPDKLYSLIKNLVNPEGPEIEAPEANGPETGETKTTPATQAEPAGPATATAGHEGSPSSLVKDKIKEYLSMVTDQADIDDLTAALNASDDEINQIAQGKDLSNDEGLENVIGELVGLANQKKLKGEPDTPAASPEASTITGSAATKTPPVPTETPSTATEPTAGKTTKTPSTATEPTEDPLISQLRNAGKKVTTSNAEAGSNEWLKLIYNFADKHNLSNDDLLKTINSGMKAAGKSPFANLPIERKEPAKVIPAKETPQTVPTERKPSVFDRQRTEDVPLTAPEPAKPEWKPNVVDVSKKTPEELGINPQRLNQLIGKIGASVGHDRAVELAKKAVAGDEQARSMVPDWESLRKAPEVTAAPQHVPPSPATNKGKKQVRPISSDVLSTPEWKKLEGMYSKMSDVMHAAGIEGYDPSSVAKNIDRFLSAKDPIKELNFAVTKLGHDLKNNELQAPAGAAPVVEPKPTKGPTPEEMRRQASIKAKNPEAKPQGGSSVGELLKNPRFKKLISDLGEEHGWELADEFEKEARKWADEGMSADDIIRDIERNLRGFQYGDKETPPTPAADFSKAPATAPKTSPKPAAAPAPKAEPEKKGGKKKPSHEDRAKQKELEDLIAQQRAEEEGDLANPEREYESPHDEDEYDDEDHLNRRGKKRKGHRNKPDRWGGGGFAPEDRYEGFSAILDKYRKLFKENSLPQPNPKLTPSQRLLFA